MEQDAPSLANALKDAQSDLEQTLAELRATVGESLAWRVWVARHPWAAMAVCAFVGIRVGRGRWL